MPQTGAMRERYARPYCGRGEAPAAGTPENGHEAIFAHDQSSTGCQTEGSSGGGYLCPTAKTLRVGHWEMTGLVTTQPFPTYPNGFPARILDLFRRANRTRCARRIKRHRARKSSKSLGGAHEDGKADRLHLRGFRFSGGGARTGDIAGKSLSNLQNCTNYTGWPRPCRPGDRASLHWNAGQISTHG